MPLTKSHWFNSPLCVFNNVELITLVTPIVTASVEPCVVLLNNINAPPLALLNWNSKVSLVFNVKYVVLCNIIAVPNVPASLVE